MYLMPLGKLSPAISARHTFFAAFLSKARVGKPHPFAFPAAKKAQTNLSPSPLQPEEQRKKNHRGLGVRTTRAAGITVKLPCQAGG